LIIKRLNNIINFVNHEIFTYPLAIPVTIFMNILVYIRIQGFQLQSVVNFIQNQYKKNPEILNATGYPSIIQSTCLKSSMGLDKAGVPLSNIAY
jgi:hypothetical protein